MRPNDTLELIQEIDKLISESENKSQEYFQRGMEVSEAGELGKLIALKSVKSFILQVFDK